MITDGPLSLEPSSSVLHYAQTIFEGLKAYRDEDGKITLFRPDMNMKRMNRSAARIALPVRIHTNELPDVTLFNGLFATGLRWRRIAEIDHETDRDRRSLGSSITGTQSLYQTHAQ